MRLNLKIFNSLPEQNQNWHLWFAWYPVRVGDNDCRWLEFVCRKAIPKTYVNHELQLMSQPYEYREY